MYVTAINYLEFFKPEIIVHKSFFESEDSTKMKTVRRPKFLSSDWNVRLEAYRDTSERIIRDQWKRERAREEQKVGHNYSILVCTGWLEGDNGAIEYGKEGNVVSLEASRAAQFTHAHTHRLMLFFSPAWSSRKTDKSKQKNGAHKLNRSQTNYHSISLRLRSAYFVNQELNETSRYQKRLSVNWWEKIKGKRD